MSAVLSNETILDEAIAAIIALRREGAVVHCLTNTVAQNFTANVLLACGATPSMTVAPDEVLSFTQRADAVLINLGTLDDQRKEAMRLSANYCASNKKPFILDPVMCHVSASRLSFSKELLKLKPFITRANSTEIRALQIEENSFGATTLVETGKADRVQWDGNTKSFSNGHEWLSRVTAIGCAQGALMAALASKVKASKNSGPIAAIGALLWMNVSGEIAAANSSGPGSFQPALIDKLHSISPQTLKHYARIT